MRLKADNYELEFKQSIDHKTNTEKGEWWATSLINNSNCTISFEEQIFKDQKTSDIKINWEFVKEVIGQFMKNIESLISKSINVLIPLHQQIFGNEYFENDLQFVLEDIEIVKYGVFEIRNSTVLPDSDIFDYQIELSFFLEPKTNSLLDPDPYFMYYAKFAKLTNTTMTLVSVARE